MYNLIRIKIGLLICSIIFVNPAFAYSIKTKSTEIAQFTRAENALKKGDLCLYKKLLKKLKNYSLYPYLLYQEMEQNIEHVSLNKLQSFINTYPDSPLGPRLRSLWLYHNAKKQQWHNFLSGYQYNDNVELQCYYIWSHYKIKKDLAILKYVEPIWLNGKSQPPACNAVFEQWEKHHVITRSVLWQRIKLAINSNNRDLARYLSKKLHKSEKQLVELWIRTNDNPYIIKQRHYFTKSHPAVAEILVHGIIKIARKDVKSAIFYWKKISRTHKFSEKHWATVVKNIGISLAKAKHPESEKWLSKISPNYVDKSILEARLIFALHTRNWRNIIRITKKLPSPLNNTEQWLYWKARALEILGKKNEGQQIFNKLAKRRSYYGFLSCVRAKIPFTFKNQASELNEKDLAAISQKPALIRAHELHKLGRHDKGNIEWNFALRNMNDKEKEIAAAIAAKWKVPNWSIIALMDSNKKNNLNLRFPQNYSKFIFREALNNQIDPALIFAITRQESAFITTARSSAGAFGLMQLIPSTAKMVSKIVNVPLYNTKDLLNPNKNIRFGSKYLRMMLDKYYQNSVLAASAYNAGPARIQNWLPKYDLPADIWIEGIPFRETKGYVKNVLTFTVIYQQLLGKNLSLTKHMPIIPGTQRLISISAADSL